MRVRIHETEAVGFLPEDYVAERRERRTNVIALALFGTVMVGIAIAFFATDRNWRDVQATRREVHRQFEHASDRIHSMEAYEAHLEAMILKANTAVGLLDAVPKSILLAEIVDRMPDGVSLTRLHFDSAPVTVARNSTPARRSLGEADAVDAAPGGPKVWASDMVLEGLAHSDHDVSVFMNRLVELALVQHVRLEFSREKEIDGEFQREFRITMEGAPGADVRALALASERER